MPKSQIQFGLVRLHPVLSDKLLGYLNHNVIGGEITLLRIVLAAHHHTPNTAHTQACRR